MSGPGLKSSPLAGVVKRVEPRGLSSDLWGWVRKDHKRPTRKDGMS